MQQEATKAQILDTLLHKSRFARERIAQLTSANTSAYEPQQLHLSITPDPSEMVIMFVTGSSCAASGATGQVKWWPASNSSAVTLVPTTEATYTAGLGWDGSIHTAFVTGLTPSAKYEYVLGCPGVGPWSLPRPFKAAPVPGGEQNTYVAVTADMGTIVPLGWAVADEIINENMYGPQPFDFVLIAGDLSYATVDPPKGEVEWTWDAFCIQNEPFASTAPWMTTVGNHEDVPGVITNASGSFNATFAAYQARFRMPGPETGGNSNLWFSYNYGNVHYSSISSEADFSVGSPMWTWLKTDLAAADAQRGVTPWVILLIHRPILSADMDEYGSHQPGAPMSAALEPLLLQYHVDMVLQGHEHCYERTAAVYNGTVITLPDANNTYTNPGAPIYIVQGTSGAMQEETFVTPTPVWSLVRTNGVWGFGRMTVNGTSLLTYEFVDTQGEVQDSFSIVRTA